MSEWTRRQFIAGVTVITVTLAGCTNGQSTEPEAPPDVVVFNNTATEITVTVTVSSESESETEESFVSQTVTIAARDAAEYEDALPSSGTFSISVNVHEGPSSNATHSLSSESVSLQAVVEDDTIEFRTR